MFASLETQLLALIHHVPLEVFVFVASFVEEVIAPIPSPPVILASGSFASMQGYALVGLFILALFGALGKTIGSIIVYTIADKAEDFLVPRFGKYFGITLADIEQLGARLGSGARIFFLLTLFRALPIMPSSLLSAGCGVLKVPFRSYILATFLGTIVRDSIFLYVGYVGTEVLNSFVVRTSPVESIVEVVLLLTIIIFLGYLFMRRSRS